MMMDNDLGLVRAFEVTNASVRDSRVDLSLPDEVVYWDKGNKGVEQCGWNASIRLGVRYHPLCI
jgi:IS5 family transposase